MSKSVSDSQACIICGHTIWKRQQKASRTYDGNHAVTIWAHKDCAERAEGISTGYWKLEGIPSGVYLT